MKVLTLAAILGLAYGQQISSSCPSQDICYRLNIPANTASSGNGDIFFQMEAPTSYSWVGLGQGTRMAGSNMFIMYTSSGGRNVTVSTRSANGHMMPTHNTNAQITLLEGTGVSNGRMTANVRCSNCQSWPGGNMDFRSSSGSWIHASLQGAALNTDDTSAPIQRHEEDYGPFTWDWTTAKGGNSANPFVTASGPPVQQPSSDTQTTVQSSGAAMGMRVVRAHGFCAAIAIVILMPSAAILIRLGNFPGVVWAHAGLQIFSYLLFTAAVGMGIWIARNGGYLMDAHPIIGLVVFSFLSLQPIGGLMHHLGYKKTGGRTAVSYAHIWLGRLVIILAIINGGLGLQLAGTPGAAPQTIAYGVLAAVFGVALIAAAVFGEMKRKRHREEASYSDTPLRSGVGHVENASDGKSE